MPKVRIRCRADSVTVETSGFKGRSCLKVSQEVNAALKAGGSRIESDELQYKDEYWEQGVAEKQEARNGGR